MKWPEPRAYDPREGNHPDARPQDARSVWERLVPQPFQPWEAKLDLAEFYRAGLPRSYIAVADDHALPEGTWHPGMSSRLGDCKIVHMDGSHEVIGPRVPTWIECSSTGSFSSNARRKMVPCVVGALK
jgi:hypothetical protein